MADLHYSEEVLPCVGPEKTPGRPGNSCCHPWSALSYQYGVGPGHGKRDPPRRRCPGDGGCVGRESPDGYEPGRYPAFSPGPGCDQGQPAGFRHGQPLRKLNGGTTVAGTITALHLAGIQVFATGGIGGVHRNAPYDISADLTNYGTNTCLGGLRGSQIDPGSASHSGNLETLSVPVVGYQTSTFPSFLCPLQRPAGHRPGGRTRRCSRTGQGPLGDGSELSRFAGSTSSPGDALPEKHE